MPHPVVRPRARPRAGFTVTEILVACALVGIVAAFAVPRVDVLRYQGDASVQLVRGTLQLAHRLALQHQWDVNVSFDVPNGRMYVTEDRNNNRQADPGERIRTVALDPGSRFVVPPVPVPGGVGNAAVVLSRSILVAHLPAISYHRSGSASGSLEVYVAAERRGRADVRAVTVVQGTGRTARFRLQNNVWKEADL